MFDPSNTYTPSHAELEALFGHLKCRAYVIVRDIHTFDELRQINRPTECPSKWIVDFSPDQTFSMLPAQCKRKISFGAFALGTQTGESDDYVGKYLVFQSQPNADHLVDFALPMPTAAEDVRFHLIPSRCSDYGQWLVQSLMGPESEDVIFDKIRPTLAPRWAWPIHVKIKVSRHKHIELEFICCLANEQVDDSEDFDPVLHSSAILSEDTYAELRRQMSFSDRTGGSPLKDAAVITVGEHDVFATKWKDLPVFHLPIDTRSDYRMFWLKEASAKDGAPPMTLDSCHEWSLSELRKLLCDMIDLVGHVNSACVTHNNINSVTMLISSQDNKLPLLSGFQKCSDWTLKGAVFDCFQVFKCFRQCHKGSSNGIAMRTGSLWLDSLISHVPEGADSWYWTCSDVRQKLLSSGFTNNSLWQTSWTPLVAYQMLTMRCINRDGKPWLNAADLIRYVRKAMISRKTTFENWNKVDECSRFLVKTLAPYTDAQGFFKYSRMERLRQVLFRRYSFALISPCVDQACSHGVANGSQHEISVSFQVPYNERYGLINLEYLTKICAEDEMAVNFDDLLASSIEILGDPKGQGFYVPIPQGDLSVLSQIFNIAFAPVALPPRQGSMDAFTYQDWYVISPPDYNLLFPCSRHSGQVQVDAATTMSLDAFLESYFLGGRSDDLETSHDPLALRTTSSAHTDEQAYTSAIGIGQPSKSTVTLPIRQAKSSTYHNRSGTRAAEEESDRLAKKGRLRL